MKISPFAGKPAHPSLLMNAKGQRVTYEKGCQGQGSPLRLRVLFESHRTICQSPIRALRHTITSDAGRAIKSQASLPDQAVAMTPGRWPAAFLSIGRKACPFFNIA